MPTPTARGCGWSPITGRTHQLRVHLLSIGHTIVGDDLYGTDATSTSRLLLHACELRFVHPVHGGECGFTQRGAVLTILPSRSARGL